MMLKQIYLVAFKNIHVINMPFFFKTKENPTLVDPQIYTLFLNKRLRKTLIITEGAKIDPDILLRFESSFYVLLNN